jgi:hypothetical protein
LSNGAGFRTPEEAFAAARVLLDALFEQQVTLTPEVAVT